MGRSHYSHVDYDFETPSTTVAIALLLPAVQRAPEGA